MEIKVCNKCFRLFKCNTFKKVNNIYQPTNSYSKCGNKKCSGELFGVDELIAPSIILLNKKGYRTKFCCSGHIAPDEVVIFCEKYKKHYRNEGIDSYITFEKNIKLPNLPKGYKFDNDNENPELNNTIRKNFNHRKNPKNLLKDIIDNSILLLEWVENLENYS